MSLIKIPKRMSPAKGDEFSTILSSTSCIVSWIWKVPSGPWLTTITLKEHILLNKDKSYP